MGKKYASRNTKTQKIALDCIYALALFVLLWSYFALVTLIQSKNILHFRVLFSQGCILL
jgi:EamA domain-containing membrane protein RarD